MLPGRASAIAAARERLAEGRAVVIAGPPGIGRTAVLAAVGDAFTSVRRASGFSLLREERHLPLAMAVRAAVPDDVVEREAVASWVAGRLGDAALVVDDAHLLDTATARVLPLLVGRSPLACALSTPSGSALLSALESAGAEVIDLDPLDADAARRVVPDAPDDLLADAGGHPRLLVDLAAGALSSRSQRMLREWAGSLDGSGRRAAALLALARGSSAEAATALGLPAGPGGRRRPPHLLGGVVIESLEPHEVRDLHEELGEAFVASGDPVAAARHFAAAGDGLRARDIALGAAAAADTDPVARAEALDIAASASPDGDPLLLEAAAAVLAVGRPAVAHLGRADGTDPRRAALAARDLRQRGEAAAAAAELAAADAADPQVRRERALLALWPEWQPARAAGAPGAATLLAAWPTPAGDLLAAAAALHAVDPEDELHRLVLLVVLGLLDGGDIEVSVASLERWSREWRGSTWQGAGAVARRLSQFHRGPSEDTLTELAAAAGPAGVVAVHGLVALADLGRTSEALRLLGAADEAADADAALRHWVAAEVNLLAGRLVPAREHALRSVEGIGLDHPVRGLAAVTGGWATLDAGDPPDAVEAWTGMLGVDRAARLEASALGLRAATSSETASAFAAAAEAWRSLSTRSWLRCRWAAADAMGVVDELEDVERDARRRGMLPLAGRARRSLRRLGVRSRAGRLAREGGLSGREREVLALVAEGVPSREIAQRLGVGRSTVETQISSAMGKLGARTRLHAVALLTDRAAS